MNTQTSVRKLLCNVRRTEMHLSSVMAGCILFAVPFLNGCGSKLPSLSEVIHVSVRQSSLDPTTAVLQIKNKHSEPLTLGGYAYNLDDRQELTFQIGTLEPGQSIELGLLEIGWAFMPNERFAIMTTEDQPYQLIAFETYRADTGSIGIKPIKVNAPKKVAGNR